jgi:hypothetical protein
LLKKKAPESARKQNEREKHGSKRHFFRSNTYTSKCDCECYNAFTSFSASYSVTEMSNYALCFGF